MSRSAVAVLARHQVGALLATAVDFVTMVLAVELHLLGPVPATALGASAGAVTNFWLSRGWIFQVGHLGMRGQLVRYAIVAALSLGWNALGEHIAVHRLGLQYVMGRVIVSVLVSVGWNYPMHRFFVFRRAASSPVVPSP